MASSHIELDIASHLKAAGIRLRHDRVVLRLVDALQLALADSIPEGQAILYAVTAPIRKPGKLVADLVELLPGIQAGEDRVLALHGNQVRIRRVAGLPRSRPRLLGFVQDAAPEFSRLLALVQARLMEPREAD